VEARPLFLLVKGNSVRFGKIRQDGNRNCSCGSPLDTSCQQSLIADAIKVHRRSVVAASVLIPEANPREE
jgi:hypothetical protein